MMLNPPTAAEIASTPAGNIAASNVQNALDELDAEKAGLHLANFFDGGQQTFVDNDSGAPPIVLRTTNDDNVSAPNQIFQRFSNSPAVGDLIGGQQWSAQNSAAGIVLYGQFLISILDPTAGSEDSALDYYLQKNGVNTHVLSITANGMSFPASSVPFTAEGPATFNNTVNAPTPPAGDNDTTVATTAFVQGEIAAFLAAQDAMIFKGVIDCSANPNYPAADRGWTYRVSVAGKIGGASGPNVEAGDILLCLTDGSASGNHAAVGANWTIAQTNLDGAVIGPASATSGNAASFNGTSGKLIQDSGKALPSGTIVGTSDSQSLSNKTLSSPTLSGTMAGAGATIQSASIDNTTVGAIIVRAVAFTLDDATDNTKLAKFDCSAIATGTTRTYTLPNVSDTLVGQTALDLKVAKAKKQVFTASGTYTPSPGMLFCIIEAVGGGGGGGSAAGTAGQIYNGGGGGAGSYARLLATSATIGASQTVTIGSGGNGGASGSNNGSNGGDTSVGTLCVGKGGSGGKYGSSGQVPLGGAGGVVGTGDITPTGAPGLPGWYGNGGTQNASPSGNGGSSFFGGGALGVSGASAAVAGNNGANYGGGGSGAAAGNIAANAAGGNGSAGVVHITEYCNQ
jgi:hypothetical protein